LSLLLKLSPLVDELSLYDVVNTPGVAADLSHISSVAVSRPAMAFSPQGPSFCCCWLDELCYRKWRAGSPRTTEQNRLSRMPTSSSSRLVFPVRHFPPREEPLREKLGGDLDGAV